MIGIDTFVSFPKQLNFFQTFLDQKVNPRMMMMKKWNEKIGQI
jgi:hypothetical protein